MIQTGVIVQEIARDDEHSSRFLVTCAFVRTLRGGAVSISEKPLWFERDRFAQWPSAKTWAPFREATTKTVVDAIAKEWGDLA